ncbi:PAS domain-containing protein [Rhodospirillaceae bacterium SYSU D60014]|uniref:PAS domain-containing protein n=1 Tax=Virgifigura deserti TaxID=2268457 RepID=UPI000E66603F
MTADEGSFNRIFDIEESIVDIETLFHSAKVKHLYDWWCMAGGGRLPSRGMFDVVDHKSIIANLFLTEVTPRGDFVFRLLGEEVIAMVGRNYTGETVKDSSWAEYGHALGAYYRSIIEAKTCRRCVGSLAFPDNDLRRFESIDCPLSSDGMAVDMIIGVMDTIR